MFCVDENNSIQWGDTRSADVSPFGNEAELVNIANARNWSKQTVTDIWNGFAGTAGSFAGLKPQKLFKNRPYGLAQIWKAIQRLVPSDAASEPAAPKVADPHADGDAAFDRAYADTGEDMPKKAKRQKKAPKAKKAVVTEAAARKTKRDDVVKLIGREKGASIQEIMDKMGWLPHSVRGFVSTLKSKHGVNIVSEKSEKRGLVYKIAA